MLNLLLVGGLGLLLCVALIFSWRRPMSGLTLLLALLPIHSGLVHLLRNVIDADTVVVSLVGSWKEAVILGLAIAAFTAWRNAPRRLGVPYVIAVGLLLMITARIPIDLAAGHPPWSVLFGARSVGEFLVVFVIVGILAPGGAWVRRTTRVVAPVIIAVSAFALVQPLLGPGFYDQFFHQSGQVLPYSFTASWGGEPRLRAAGTYESPNELGLGLIIVVLALIGPRFASFDGHGLAVCIGLALSAVVLSFSRSAALGAIIGIFVALVVGWPYIRKHGLFHDRISPISVLLILVPLVSGLGIFLLSGGIEFVAATVSGTDTSAAARPSSIRVGLSALFDHPFGLGLGTVGPKALLLDNGALQTENWYLVFGLQTGWLPLTTLGLLLLSLGSGIWHRCRSIARGLAPVALAQREDHLTVLMSLGALASFLAALTGALVIPALLDLPVAILLWTMLAVISPAAADSTFGQQHEQ